jgi:hypothetical protein
MCPLLWIKRRICKTSKNNVLCFISNEEIGAGKGKILPKS